MKTKIRKFTIYIFACFTDHLKISDYSILKHFIFQESSCICISAVSLDPLNRCQDVFDVIIQQMRILAHMRLASAKTR